MTNPEYQLICKRLKSVTKNRKHKMHTNKLQYNALGSTYWWNVIHIGRSVNSLYQKVWEMERIKNENNNIK